MKTATVRARIEPTLKVEVETVLTELGLSISEAIELYLRQIKLTHGIPFNICIPNEITKETFEKTDKGRELHYYRTPEDMFRALNN